jgi:hypothetical protein
MPWSKDPDVQTLRSKYNVAVSAHAECSRALIEATMSGAAPLPALVAAERKARLRMEEARQKLYDAMVSGLGHAPEASGRTESEGD